MHTTNVPTLKFYLTEFEELLEIDDKSVKSNTVEPICNGKFKLHTKICIYHYPVHEIVLKMVTF